VFTVVITKDARRRLRRMPRNMERTIISKIEDLAADPFAPSNNVTALTAADGFRLRIGDWRVLYTLDTGAGRMTIVAIVPRGDAYR
jgi:mRNA interferase RelE/StbE